MSKWLFMGVATAALLGAQPAHAVLQIALQVGPDSFLCVDNTACDTNPAVGTVQVGNTLVDGIEVNGSIQESIHGAVFPTLDTSSLSITNTLGATVIATVAVSDTDFKAVVARFVTSAGGVWVGPSGATTTQGWWIDAANDQGASNAFDTPGTEIDSFSAINTPLTEAFSHNGGTIMNLIAPFSLTEQATFTLPAGEELLNRGQAIVGIAAPEPSTWAMMGIGFGVMAFFGLRKRRGDRLKVAF